MMVSVSLLLLVLTLLLVLAIATATTSVPVPVSSEGLFVRRLADDTVLAGSHNRFKCASEMVPRLSASVTTGRQ